LQSYADSRGLKYNPRPLPPSQPHAQSWGFRKTSTSSASWEPASGITLYFQATSGGAETITDSILPLIPNRTPRSYSRLNSRYLSHVLHHSAGLFLPLTVPEALHLEEAESRALRRLKQTLLLCMALTYWSSPPKKIENSCYKLICPWRGVRQTVACTKCLQCQNREREIYFKSHVSLWEHSSHCRLIGRGVPSVSVFSLLMYKFLCLASPKENPQVPM